MADTTNRLAGTASVTVDGVNYMLVGKLSYRVSTVTRESLVGQDNVHGYKEMPVAGMIGGTFRDGGGLSVASINGMTNVSVVAELANGKTIVGGNMWTVDAQDVDTEDGSFEVKWEGRSVSEA